MLERFNFFSVTAFSRVNQWQIWRAFAKAVHSWGPRCCVVVGLFAVCAMFRAGGYRSVENYLSRIKDLHVEEGFDWSMSLERAFRKSERAVNRGIGPARQSAALDLGAAFKALENHFALLLYVIGVLWGFGTCSWLVASGC